MTSPALNPSKTSVVVSLPYAVTCNGDPVQAEEPAQTKSPALFVQNTPIISPSAKSDDKASGVINSVMLDPVFSAEKSKAAQAGSSQGVPP